MKVCKKSKPAKIATSLRRNASRALRFILSNEDWFIHGGNATATTSRNKKVTLSANTFLYVCLPLPLHCLAELI